MVVGTSSERCTRVILPSRIVTIVSQTSRVVGRCAITTRVVFPLSSAKVWRKSASEA